MPAIKPKTRDSLTVVFLDGEAVIYDEPHDGLHHLNATAALIFSFCDGSATMRQISAELAGSFGVPETEVEPQVRSVVRRFRRAGLLERRAPVAEVGASDG
jgi:Coenzyme PQQ synthesis protein D (PqqD)